MTKLYMLDTDTCSYIMRERPPSVLANLQDRTAKRHSIVLSAISYAELRFGAIGKKAGRGANALIDDFLTRIDDILPWDRAAADAATAIVSALGAAGKLIGPNDTLIAGHAVSKQCILVSNNTKEFGRVAGLELENWVAAA